MAKVRGERSYWERRYHEWWDRPFHGMSQATEDFMTREEDGIRGKIGRLLEPHHRVLDAGCGYGRIAPMVCPLVKTFVGVDFAHQAIECALKNRPANASFFVADLADLGAFQFDPFDVILMVGVQSSVHYRPEVLEHLRSLLAPDGMIAVFEYGTDSVISKDGEWEPL